MVPFETPVARMFLSVLKWFNPILDPALKSTVTENPVVAANQYRADSVVPKDQLAYRHSKGKSREIV